MSRADLTPADPYLPRTAPGCLLIGGTGRCGTSILAHALWSLPSVVYLPEWRLFTREGPIHQLLRGHGDLDRFAADFPAQILDKNRQLRISANGCAEQRMSRDVIGSGNLQDMITTSRALHGDNRQELVRDLLARIFDFFLRALDRLYLVEKTPHSVLLADMVTALLPTSRYVHVIRDPRDVFCSTREQDWGPSDLEAFTGYYRDIAGQAIEARKTVPQDRYLTLGLETLVSRPEESLTRVIEFAGVPATQSDVVRACRQIEPRHARIQRYREDLSEDEARRVAEACDELYRFWLEDEKRGACCPARPLQSTERPSELA